MFIKHYICIKFINVIKIKEMGISEWIMGIDPTIRAIIGINVCICLAIYWYFVNKKKKEKEHIYKEKKNNRK